MRSTAREKEENVGGTVTEQVLTSIKNALSRYGSTAPRVIFWNFEKSHNNLKDGDIFRYPEDFAQSLQKMFGIGAQTIESVIVREIKSSVPELRDVQSESLVFILKRARVLDQRAKEY